MTVYEIEEVPLWVNKDDETFELGDDEIILASEYRSGTRIVMAIASPVETCGVCGCGGACDHDCCGE